VWVKGFLK